MDKSKKKSSKREQPKSWLHPASHLVNGSIIYNVKYWGSTEVDDPKGADVVKGAIERLKFQVHVKKGQGHKPPKVELCISYQALRVQDAKTKAFIHQHPLSKISYCGDDKSNKAVFAYISKEKDSDGHFCYVFETDKFADQITLTVGQAFDLAFKKFKGGSEDVELKQRMMTMQKSMDEAEAEKHALRKRIAELQMKKDMGDVEQMKLREQVQTGDLLGPQVPQSSRPAAPAPVQQQQQQQQPSWATFDQPAPAVPAPVAAPMQAQQQPMDNPYSTLARQDLVQPPPPAAAPDAGWASFDSPAPAQQAAPAQPNASWVSQSATQAVQAPAGGGGGWASFDEPTYSNVPSAGAQEGAYSSAGTFQPFTSSEPAQTMPALGGVNDIDDAINNIEAQLAGLQDGFEEGFSLDPMSPTSPTAPAGAGDGALLQF